MTTQALSKEQLLADIAHAEEKAATLCGPCADDHARLAGYLRALLAAHEQKPVFFVEIEGDDWINSGRIEGKDRPDLGLLPDGINNLYAHSAPSIPAAVPDGYVLVPIEPTITILDEIDAIFDFGAEDSKDAWHRLLAAAPKGGGE